MRIHYNAPVTLGIFIISCLVMLINQVLPSFIQNFCTTYPHYTNMFWLQSFTHIFGHANLEHLTGNMTLILLLGPILEEKYSSPSLLIMVLTTAFITGTLNLFLSTGLLGASGICFLFIILSSFGNQVQNTIPLTFVLLAFLYLGGEVINAFGNNNISQFAHILGGISGSAFGFLIGSTKVK